MQLPPSFGSGDFDPYSHPTSYQHQAMRYDDGPPTERNRTNGAMQLTINTVNPHDPQGGQNPPLSARSYGHTAPSSAASAYFEPPPLNSPLPMVRQHTGSSISTHSVMRPSSSSRRYDPYAPSSPRSTHSSHSRRPSGPSSNMNQHDFAYAEPPLDVKPVLSPIMSHPPSPYHYQPPATAPGAFAEFGAYPSNASSMPPSVAYAPQYTSWQAPPSSGRFPISHPREYVAQPPSSAESTHSAGHMSHQHDTLTAHTAHGGMMENGGGWGGPQMVADNWNQGYPMAEPASDWRAEGTGTSVV